MLGASPFLPRDGPASPQQLAAAAEDTHASIHALRWPRPPPRLPASCRAPEGPRAGACPLRQRGLPAGWSRRPQLVPSLLGWSRHPRRWLAVPCACRPRARVFASVTPVARLVVVALWQGRGRLRADRGPAPAAPFDGHSSFPPPTLGAPRPLASLPPSMLVAAARALPPLRRPPAVACLPQSVSGLSSRPHPCQAAPIRVGPAQVASALGPGRTCQFVTA